jgi:hypothetical protein
MIRQSRWRKRIVIFGVCIAGIWLLRRLDILPPWKEVFTAKPVVIDETPILIKEIRSIGQLVSATLYDEVVVDSTETTKASRVINSLNRIGPFHILPPADKRIVLIAKGKVLAGTDFNLLTDSSLRISKDTVWLGLPRTRIIDVIMNPSDFETFEEKGKWSAEAVTAVKIKAREKVIDRALNQNIIERAGNKTKAVMEDFLHAAGFKVVLFTQ